VVQRLKPYHHVPVVAPQTGQVTGAGWEDKYTSWNAATQFIVTRVL